MEKHIFTVQENMQSIKASMYISPTRMMLASQHLVADVHQHAVIQFTCSLDGKPFSVWTQDKGWQKAEAVLINSNIAHGVKDFEGWQVTICIIPDAGKGKLIQEKVLEGKDIRFFTAEEIQPALDILQITKNKILESSSAFNEISDAVYDHLIGSKHIMPPLDERISKTIIHIRKNIHQNFSAATLAAEVHLSEHRFLHLFKEQVGAPLRQYILWLRLAAATQAFIEGKSSKEAAYEAGFSDPAHFSRTFLQMFGAQPSSYAAFKQYYYLDFFQDF
jgi:AraC-like DNA-binding protein